MNLRALALVPLLIATTGCWWSDAFRGGASKPKGGEPSAEDGAKKGDAKKSGSKGGGKNRVAKALGGGPAEAFESFAPLEPFMSAAEAKDEAPDGFDAKKFKGCERQKWNVNQFRSRVIDRCYVLDSLPTCQGSGCSVVSGFDIRFEYFDKGDIAKRVRKAWGRGKRVKHPHGKFQMYLDEDAGIRAFFREGYRIELGRYLSPKAVVPKKSGKPGKAFKGIWGKKLKTLQEKFGDRLEVDWDRHNRVHHATLTMPPFAGELGYTKVTLLFTKAGKMVELSFPVADSMDTATEPQIQMLLAKRFDKTRKLISTGKGKKGTRYRARPYVYAWTGFGDVTRIAMTTRPKRSFF